MTIWILVFLVAVVAVIGNSIVLAPTFKRGQVRRFKRLTGRIVGPGGLHFISPFIEDVIWETAASDPLTTETLREPISVIVISADNLEIEVGGSFLWRIDPDLIETHIQLGKDVIKGSSDAIESEIGVIASKQDGRSFREQRGPIQTLINCVLRFGTPPHYDPQVFGLPETGEIEVQDRLDFYQRHSKMLRERLAKEAENVSDRSAVERRYGIDAVGFELTKVRFTKETMEALEEEQQAAARMDAAEKIRRKKIEVFEELLGKGLTPQQAINEASVLVEQAVKQVHSIEGLEKGLINVTLNKGENNG